MAKIASKVTNESGVRFEFIDNEYVNCEVDKLPQDMLKRLAIHGIAQKVGDSYAGAESVTDARIMAQNVWNNLKAGIWAAKATRGGKIVEALHRATGQPLDVCLEKYSAMNDADKKALKKHPSIKVALAEIEAENAAKLAEATTGEETDLNDLF